VLRPPAGHADAACREHPEVSWFPERGEPTTAAKAICSGCLVKQECAAYALGHEEALDGIWGRRQRAAMRRAA
jgi:WhiB family redox-sensing transcriptional regulator